MAQRYYSNIAIATTLVGGINGSDTAIVVGSTSGFPASTPYSLAIDFELSTQEVVEVTGVAGTTLTVTRGVDNTSAQAHATGAPIVHAITKRDVSEPNDHIQATTNVHGLSGGAAVVGSTSAQTLTNKTMSGGSNTFTALPAAQVTGTFSSVTSSGGVSGTTGTFSGAVAGTTGTFSGAVSGTTITGSGAVAGTTLTGSSTVQGTALIPTGLTGATSASRYVGATASGAPVSGTFATGDYIIDLTGKIFVCTSGGTSGTWTNVGSLYLPLAGGTLTGGLSGTTGTFSGALAGASVAATGAATSATVVTTGNVTVGGDLSVTGIGRTYFIRKPADETINNTTALQSDDDLVLAPAINATYILEGLVIYVSPAAADFKFAFTYPAAATLTWTGGGHAVTGSSGSGDMATNVALRLAGDSTFSYGGGEAFACSLQVKGTLIMGGTSGNLQVRWAQATATVGDTAVKLDSWLKLTRVA